MLTRRLLFTLALLPLLAATAYAQSPLGVGSAEPAFSIGGPFGSLLAWINAGQQSFYRSLTAALVAMRQDPWALSALIGLSFAYGIFHAAGPGHGKAVISSYMIANEIELRRGVAISFISSLLQGFVAIALVGAAYLVLRGSGITMSVATRAMEIASFALVALFGAWLLFRKIRALKMRLVRAKNPTPATALAFETPAAANPLSRRGATGLNFRAIEIDDHEHRGEGEYCDTCGVSHMPDPSMLRAENFSLREAWSAIVAVGLRPCSGAILVVSFSLLNGLYLGGVLSVLAMSIGTAITVTTLAILTVTAKDAVLRFAGPGSRTGRRLTHAIEIAGALFLLLMGLSLLAASLTG